MPILVSAADYPQVRAALDLSLTAAELPDATIALSIYAGEAEAEVLRADPLGDTYTDGTVKNLAARRAAIYYTAARILPSKPQVKQKTASSGFAYSLQPYEVAARVAELRTKAEAALAAYLEPGGRSALPTLFTVARGYRGR